MTALPKDARIFVAGHRGMVGSAITRALQAAGYKNLLLRTRKEVDLADHAAVRRFFDAEKPEYVFLAAAKVGGILANNTPRRLHLRQPRHRGEYLRRGAPRRRQAHAV